MTAICNSEVLETRSAAQNETMNSEVCLTDAEVMRRVRDIRSTWSRAERNARREEADKRFENLLETIFAKAA
ncbi:hypothetical protein NHH03_08375 [Stieleria sp. TO1_6]|nr:hypothetical protein [Stieleria tagensis]